MKQNGQKLDYKISKKRNKSIELSFSFYFISLSLKSEVDIKKKIYVNFDDHMSRTKIIVYSFFHYL